jgi:hypothetical protein
MADERKLRVVGCLSPGTPEWDFFASEVRKAWKKKEAGASGETPASE